MLDPGSRHSLAVVRGIGRAGWPAVAAGVERKVEAIAAASRYCVAYERIPSPWGPAGEVELALRGLVERYAVRAVVMCSDVTVARLRGLDIGVPTVPELGEPLDRLTDKLALQEICAAAGVMYPSTSAEVDAPAAVLGDAPWVVKPRRTAIASSERVVSRTGAAVATTEAERASAFSELHALGLEPIIQKRVGRAFKVNVSFVRRGTTSFEIAYRVLREHPHQGGLAATIETLDPATGIGRRALDAAQRVCDIAGYAGLANVEFYGQADGELCLIEVNPRAWGSIAFPEELGLRPIERALLDVFGMPPSPPLRYRAGRRFHRPTLELKLFARPQPERLARLKLIASIRPWDFFDVVSVSDPLPLARALGQIVQRGARILLSVIPRPR